VVEGRCKKQNAGAGSKTQEAGSKTQEAGSKKQRHCQRLRNPASFVFEIGSEELPATDVSSALAQLRELARRC